MSDFLTLPQSATLHLESGFTLGWVPDSSNVLTGQIVGWHGSAPMKRNKSPRLGAHGTYSERGWKDERLIIVPGAFVGSSRASAAAALDQLAGYLGDGLDGTFEVNDANLGLRWANVYLADGGFDPKWKSAKSFTYDLHLVATDPRKYGTKISVPNTGIPVLDGGLQTEPLMGNIGTDVLDFGTAGYPGTATLTNIGTADTGPVHTITGTNVPGFTITEVITQRRLVFTDTIQAGQTLVINTDDGSVMLDGYASRRAKLTVAQWTRLGPGQTGTWLFESPGSTGANMKVEVTPAWW